MLLADWEKQLLLLVILRERSRIAVCEKNLLLLCQWKKHLLLLRLQGCLGIETIQQVIFG